LYHAEEDREEDDHNCNPESIPLNAIAAINPPLLDGCGIGLIELLFQNHQSIMPEFEVFNLPLLGSESAAFCGFPVKH
jgi:hypothetical protein